MKRFTTLLLLLMILSSGFAQNNKAEVRSLSIKAVLNKSHSFYPAGTPITICGYTWRPTAEGSQDALIVQIDSIQTIFPSSVKKKLTMKPETTAEFWQAVRLQNDLYEYPARTRSELRQELDDNSRDFVADLKNFTYTADPKIAEYLQTLFVRMIPSDGDFNRPGRLTMRLIQSPHPEAYMLPNGTLIIGTGLLAALDSEDELVAIMSNEITHYVLDNQVASVVRAQKRARNAAVWGGILAAAAYVGSEVAWYEDNAKLAAASVATDIASIAVRASAPQINMLGLKYSMKQEEAADKIVKNFLTFKGYNPEALGSALVKIRWYYQLERQTNEIVRYGSTETLNRRLEKLDRTANLQNNDYQKLMSGVVTFTASMYQGDRYYRISQLLARKNINNNFASEHDYVIYVQSRMEQENSPASNQECLELIRKAKAISTVPNLDIYKQEAQLLMRLNNYVEAEGVLKEYMNLLTDYKTQPDSKEDKEWILQEMEWSKEMLLKANVINS